MMKKYIIIAFMVFPVLLHAQRFEGGIVAGLNVSQIDGDFKSGYEKASPVAGAFVHTELEDKWGAQMEIRYAGKGANVSDSLLFRKVRFQYIELPVMATYDAFKKVQFQGGASLGYLYRAQQNDGPGYEDFDEISDFELAAFIGASYMYSNRLYFNVRGSYSILPIRALYSGATGYYAMYNNVITFSAYFWFGRNYY